MSTSRIVLRGTSAPRHASMPTASGARAPGGGTAAIGRSARKALSEMLSGVMTAAMHAVAEATPIATGHAQSNWILSTGSPYAGVDGSRESVSEAAQVHGLEKMAKYDVGRDGRIYLTNNVDYMPDLADGSSPQQPEPGWMTRAFLSASKVAPRGRKAGVRKALGAMAKSALKQGK